MPATKHRVLQQLPTGPVDWVAAFNANVNILEAGRTLKLEAGEAMTQYLAFYIKATDGNAYLADATTGIDGIWQSGSTGIGSTGLGQIDGVMENLGWTWTQGATIYATTSGALTETPTANVVGRALSATEILIEPGGPLGTHSHTLSDITDVTATASEINLLDLSGLSVGEVLRATGAATAAWGAILETDISPGSLLARVADAETITGIWRFNDNIGLNTATFGTSFAGGIAIKLGAINTADVTDQVHMAVVDRAAGKAGLVIRAEDGTQHIISDLFGIGTLDPKQALHVQGAENQIVISDEDGERGLELGYDSTANYAWIQAYDRGATAYKKLFFDATDIHFRLAGTTAASFYNPSRFLLNTTTGPTGATPQIVIKNNGVTVSGDVADQWTLWAYDQVAGNTCPHFRTENGSVIRLFREAALTAADATVIDSTYGADEEGVINNLRIRLNELEARLQSGGIGLLN